MRKTITGIAFLVPLLLLPAVTSAPGSAALDPIRAAVDEGQAEEAIRALDALHDKGDASAESHHLLGLAYQIRLDEVGLLSKRRIAGKLRATLERALELDPEHVGAHEELADFFFFAPGIVGGSRRRAEEQIQKLAAVSAYDGQRVRGRHAHSTEKYREAESHFTKALELRNEDGWLWYQRANARVQLREKDVQAFADYERALALGYDEPIVHYQIGRLCVRLETCAERGEESLRHFIANSEGRNLAFGRYRLAQLHEQAGRLREARDEARKAIAIEPKLDAAEALLARVEEKMDLPGSERSRG